MDMLPKLIASDIDGTLLPPGETDIPARIVALLRRLTERGILFCPASGRQYHSLRRLFAPVADELCYLCENGSILFGPGPEKTAPVLSKTAIPRDAAMELVHAMLFHPGCEPVVSGQNTSYVHREQEQLRRDIERYVGNRMAVFDVPEDIPEDVVKIAAYCPSTIAEVERDLRPDWETRLNVAVAGAEWLDFTPETKGTGILRLCAVLGVAPGETLAIGDNFNDAPMLDAVGRPWIMSGAAPTLTARYPNHCDDVAALLERILEGGGA